MGDFNAEMSHHAGKLRLKFRLNIKNKFVFKSEENKRNNLNKQSFTICLSGYMGYEEHAILTDPKIVL